MDDVPASRQEGAPISTYGSMPLSMRRSSLRRSSVASQAANAQLEAARARRESERREREARARRKSQEVPDSIGHLHKSKKESNSVGGVFRVGFSDQHEPLMSDAEFNYIISDLSNLNLKERESVVEIKKRTVNFRETTRFAKIREDIESGPTTSYDPEDIAPLVPMNSTLKHSIHEHRPPPWNSRFAREDQDSPLREGNRYGATWYLSPEHWREHYHHAIGRDEDDLLVGAGQAHSPSAGRRAGDATVRFGETEGRGSPERAGHNGSSLSPGRRQSRAAPQQGRRKSASPSRRVTMSSQAGGTGGPARASALSPSRLNRSTSSGTAKKQKSAGKNGSIPPARPSAFFAPPAKLDFGVTLSEAAQLDESEDPLEVLAGKMKELQPKLRDAYSSRVLRAYLVANHLPVPHYLERVPMPEKVQVNARGMEMSWRASVTTEEEAPQIASPVKHPLQIAQQGGQGSIRSTPMAASIRAKSRKELHGPEEGQRLGRGLSHAGSGSRFQGPASRQGSSSLSGQGELPSSRLGSRVGSRLASQRNSISSAGNGGGGQ